MTGTSARRALRERAAELARLDALAGNIAQGTGRVALILGPPGIGKTRLLEEAGRRALGRGVAVLSARASELERSFAFGLVHQLLDAPVRSDREHLLTGAAGQAQPLFDAAATPQADPSYAVLHGLYWLIANLAERAPLLLAIDDAHWSDLPSVRFLEYLARRVEGMPVGVVLASRGVAAQPSSKRSRTSPATPSGSSRAR